MSPQQQVIFNEKCILHITGGVFRGEVERLKIVPVMFNLGPLCNRKSKSRKNRADLFDNQRDRMFGALQWMAPRKRGINSLRLKTDSNNFLLCRFDCGA